MRSRTVLTAVAATALTAVLAACGGGSGGSGGSGDSELAAVKSAGTLKVGTEGTYSPFSFHDPSSNALTGYDVDVAKAVADKLGVKVEYVETPFDAIFAGLSAKRFDVVVNQVTKNPQREGLYGLSTTYTYSEGVVATRADDSSITSLAGLSGKKSAQSLTSNWAQVAKDAGAQVESVEGFTQAVTLLKQKRVDATVNDNLVILDYQKSTGDTSVKIAASTGDVSQQVIATRKGSDLVGAVDTALADLKKDGTLKSISEKYFKEDVSVAPSGAGTPATSATS
ncbi:amino acid ABC transporter substrate-binding protein [Terracoccus luteus]|jgi:cystine transport system substrate-binding protein|uniref:ABC-type amino acid transport substrate-binding protein n=1 Tax=Terracoccus luteus TaxID=53356 RepID=A0A495XYZ8_9MICO|nr:amino acid ABC transporter substrate-binding protein [Terracoccus luteus]MBB2985642.1 ABC-type amino acid transport substrate-binding protein [Terracoccus luteus]MCP2171294.1 ABC-type amino acid transport substrate-binding protein [Terracoccus luteus]RKT78395.1 amino acid ABC transporter substrate-binding protein (PAAT family) [Terracoccus luteus]